MNDLYLKITELCKEYGVSPFKMCKDIGLTSGFISDLKMGRQSGITATKAAKIADYFGITVDELLGNEPPEVLRADEETIRLQQALLDRPELRLLFQAAENAPASEVLNAAAQILRYKEQNQ